MNSDDIVGLVAVVMVFLVPIIVVFTRHQQRMTELLRQNHSGVEANRVANEIAALKQVVYQQAVTMDNLAGMLKQVIEKQSDSVALLQARQSAPPAMPESTESRTLSG